MHVSPETDVPHRPTIYRTTIKALIREERVASDASPRIRITYEGKVLPYQWD